MHPRTSVLMRYGGVMRSPSTRSSGVMHPVARPCRLRLLSVSAPGCQPARPGQPPGPGCLLAGERVLTAGSLPRRVLTRPCAAGFGSAVAASCLHQNPPPSLRCLLPRHLRICLFIVRVCEVTMFAVGDFDVI